MTHAEGLQALEDMLAIREGGGYPIQIAYDDATRTVHVSQKLDKHRESWGCALTLLGAIQQMVLGRTLPTNSSKWYGDNTGGGIRELSWAGRLK